MKEYCFAKRMPNGKIVYRARNNEISAKKSCALHYKWDDIFWMFRHYEMFLDGWYIEEV